MRRRYKINKKVRRTNLGLKFLSIFALIGFSSIGVYSQIPDSSQQQQVAADQPVYEYAQPVQAEAVAEPKLEITTPIPWPEYGHAAYIVPEDELVATHDSDEEIVPIASLSKLITVLAVLDKEPLVIGDQGRVLQMNEADAELVGYYARKSGTTSPVLAGQEITQYQAMQAILMVSSNNLADSLAIHTFGSMENYTAYANTMLKELGLASTVVADDASGYSPNTQSTASEVAMIGYLFMKNPVLREITTQKSAVIPVAGTIYNNNYFFDEEGLYGIKFGNTDDAGKCFIVASIRETADNKEEVSVSVVLGADTFTEVAQDAEAVLLAGNVGHDSLIKSPQP